MTLNQKSILFLSTAEVPGYRQRSIVRNSQKAYFYILTCITCQNNQTNLLGTDGGSAVEGPLHKEVGGGLIGAEGAL